MTNNLLASSLIWIDFQIVDVVQNCLHPVNVKKEREKNHELMGSKVQFYRANLTREQGNFVIGFLKFRKFA